ncbi:MAG: serine protein kinase RIO [Proteobacteria bacterium]|nr:MAG: serine protein kinase RIO [Pseudomonadota bacterium]
MKIPKRLQPLLDAHIIEDVIGKLQSGKEAEVYVVRAKGELCCAKVYKEENNRSFKQKTQYTEGRKVRSTRRARAMESSSRYGRQEREAEWQNTEVDALYLLASAGVRVPKPMEYYEGVLLLEMITDAEGNPAPRLNDVELTADQARVQHRFLIREAVKMLCAGLVHGDLSEFNVLSAKDGLVIIDLPQAIQATANNAFGLFERDFTQLSAFFGRFAPEILGSNYAKEIWLLFENGKLKPDSPLTGIIEEDKRKANVKAVLAEIEDAREEAMAKRGFDNE